MKQPGTAGIKRQASTACTPELGMLGLSLRMSMRGDNAEQFADGNVNTLRRANTVKTIVVANDARPLDMISFLANDEWIINDTKEKSPGFESLDENNEDFSLSLRESDLVPSAENLAIPGTAGGDGEGGTTPGSLTIQLAEEIKGHISNEPGAATNIE